MIPQSEVGRYLSELAARRENVARRLEIGDPIQRNLGSFYLIDDLGIARILGEIKPGIIPYDAVRRTLRSSWGEIQKVFAEQGSEIPEGHSLEFSKIVRAGLGECVERAALLQLAIQDYMESYFCMGFLKEDHEQCLNGHGFNVILIDGSPHVVDVQNPLLDESDKEHPYIVPITGVNDEDVSEVLVPDICRFGRRYYI